MSASKFCGVCKKRKPDTTDYFSAYTTNSGNPSRRGTCKECMSERSRRHHRERTDLRHAALERRRERNALAEGAHTPADIVKLRKKLRDKCFYCGIVVGDAFSIDHMTPLSKGGTNWPSNLALACKPCNFDKHSKTAAAFVQWRIKHNLPCTARARALLRAS